MTPADAMHAARSDPGDPRCISAFAGRPRHRAHWSPGAARRTLRAMLRLGFQGTTRQIWDHTGSMAVHTDIFQVRCYVEDQGICTHEAAVSKTYLGTNEADRRIYRYELHPLVIAAIKRGLLDEEEPDVEASAPSRTSRTDARPRQARLFSDVLSSMPRPGGRHAT